jgi:SdrD B-like domain/Peptidase family M23
MTTTHTRWGRIGRFAILRVESMEDRLTPVTWPLPDSHEMMTGFGDGSPPSTFKFHEGIDIWADGQGGQKVVAARKGKIVFIDPMVQGGWVTLEVDGVKEWDSYLHVDLKAGLKVGDAIGEGDELGKIATFHDAGSRHLHFDVSDTAPGADGSVPETAFLNPLLRFTAAADRDPLENSPTLRDTNKDNKTLLVTPNGDYANPFPKQPIKGDVDLIADAVDPMNSTLRFVANPYSIGYYVKPLFDQGLAAPYARGVKTAANPYVLAKFDDTWFDGIVGPPAVATSTKFNEVYDKEHPADVGTLQFARLDHYIVTNTKGENGKIDNVDENQYWNTDAKEDNAADWTNYTGKPNAGKNAEARFKDGDYEAHITLADLATNVDKKAGKMRVVNFDRVAAVDLGGQASNQGLNPILYSPSDAPWVPDFTPTAVVAPITKFFWLGDMVGSKGEQYYPNMPMGAFVHPHKAGGWNDGDALDQGHVAFTIDESDANGVVPLTETWLSNQVGLFDLIIDYDNDAKFSWKLDGVTGFLVLPKIIIGNWVWGDAGPEGQGANGIQDPGEIWGSPGITVNLYLADGTFVASTVTGDNGYYQFEIAEETPQWYYLEFVRPLGAYFSPKDAGPDDKDSDADPITGITDPFPSPQFYGEWVDDTRDCGMWAIPTFMPPKDKNPDPSPSEPGPNTTDATVPKSTMDLTSDVWTQVAQDSTRMTFGDANSAATWGAVAGPTNQLGGNMSQPGRSSHAPGKGSTPGLHYSTISRPRRSRWSPGRNPLDPISSWTATRSAIASDTLGHRCEVRGRPAQ